MRWMILGFTALFTWACSNATQPSKRKIKKIIPVDESLFKHGVASGDPTSDAVIIWTRVSTDQNASTVKWEISKSQDFSDIVSSGLKTTDERFDYTVKVDVQSLEAQQIYYYRFITEDKSSPVGKTKTLPVGTTDNVKLGIVSCSNYAVSYTHLTLPTILRV